MRVAILGSGGHAHVLRDALGRNEQAYFVQPDDEPHAGDTVAIGIGDLGKRARLFGIYRERVTVVVHAAATIERSADFGRGAQLLARCFIGARAQLGVNVLINTAAQIDHDCVIGSHSHIAPGAILCGGVHIGEGSFVGAGAIIVEGVTLEPGTFVPAGTLVVGQTDMRRPVRGVRVGKGSAAG